MNASDGSYLPETDAELLEKLRHSDPGVRSAGLDQFARIYSVGLGNYLQQTFPYPATRAALDDLLQEFFLKKLLRGTLVDSWQPDRPFRPYLKQCVRNFVTEILRLNPKHESVSLEHPWMPAEGAEFRAEFAVEIAAWLNQARAAMLQECELRGKAYLYTFRHFLEQPLWLGILPPTYRDASRDEAYGAEASDKVVAGYVARTRDLWRDCIRTVLYRITGGNAQEVEELLQFAEKATRSPVTCNSVFHALRGDTAPSTDHIETLNTVFRPQLPAERDMRELLDQRQAVLNALLTWRDKGSATDIECTVEELLLSPHASAEPWKSLKRLAKKIVESQDRRTGEVGKVFYAISIAGSLVYARAFISSNPPTQLKQNFRLALEEEWLNARMICLLKEGCDFLEGSN